MRAFVRDEIKPVALHPSRLEPFAKPLLTDLLAAASNMGLRALMLSEAAGGAGADTMTACIVAEELAQGDPDIAVVLAHGAALAPRLFDEAMSEAQRNRYLAKFNDDAACHLAYAGRNPRAGRAVDYHRAASEARPAPADAVKNAAGDWTVNGEIPVVANAGVAQLFVVDAGSASGPVTLLLARATPGLSIHEISAARGGATVRWGHGAPGKVVLKDCKVAAGDALGESFFDAYAIRSALAVASANIGVGQAAFEAAIDYTKLRRQGGKKTIEHQAIGTFLADMAIKLEAARNMVWKAAWVLDHADAVADRSVSAYPLDLMACAYVAEAMVSVTERAAECFGAMGVMRDMPLQKYVDDALMFKHGEIGVAATKLLVAEAVAGFDRNKA